MISVTPQGSIYLCKTPLINDYKNQLTFSSLTSQLNYFNSRIQKTFDNYTYIKKDNVIKVGENIDTIINYNYLFYRNNGFTNKYYFCFITHMEYINENCTAITIETDTFQTYQFDISYNACFVEREHTNNDTIGANTIDEGLQLGEYIVNKKNKWLNNGVDETAIYTNSNYDIVLGVSEVNDSSMPLVKPGIQIDGIYSALRYFVYHNNTAGISALNDKIETYTSNSKADAIKCLFMIPSMFTSGAGDREDHLYAGSNSTTDRYINFGNAPSLRTDLDLVQNNLQGYVPVNNKLLTYPYNYLVCSNNSGTNVIYKLEDFTNRVAKFMIQACMTPSGSIRLVPYEYKGTQFNDNEGINMGKFPICSWDTDVYINWLTQNGVNVALSTIGSAISIGAAAATGNPIGIASGVLGIANTLGEIYKESKVPDQANGNINSGDVVTASGKNDFIFYNMSIKAEYAQIIDKYFSCYGYKTNLVKVPNITGRTNWNYVKTQECNFTGNDIPQEDLNVIRTMFNNGVTLWHNSSTMLDYSQSNAIV